MIRILLLFQITFVYTTFSFAQEKFEHSMWEWIQGSEISDKKLYEIAPHFPLPNKYQNDIEAYDNAVYKWQKLYCFEYEKLINTPELTKLNPYYDGYQDIVQLPYFILPLESYEQPVKPTSFNTVDEELDYELQLQAWYFVFEPEEFYKKYKIDLEFPTWFDEEVYRKTIVDKIEKTKEAREKGIETDYPE